MSLANGVQTFYCTVPLVHRRGRWCDSHKILSISTVLCKRRQPNNYNESTITMASQSQSPIQQQSSQDTMPPHNLPVKPIDYLYSSMRPSFLKSQPNSLNSMMGNGSPLSAVRSAFLDMEKQRATSTKAVNFECDYGYGYGEDSEQEPPSKRRRFQRRNSKTPAMLMSMSASLVQLEFLDEEKKEEEERLKLLNITTKKDESSEEDDDDDWDGGLEIAEELVKHLQQRRRSSSVSSTASISFR
jgi:hypothetical protein